MIDENIESRSMRIIYIHLLPFLNIDSLVNMLFANKHFYEETLMYIKERVNENDFAKQFILFMIERNLDFIFELKKSNNEIFPIILKKLLSFNDNNFNITLRDIFKKRNNLISNLNTHWKKLITAQTIRQDWYLMGKNLTYELTNDRGSGYYLSSNNLKNNLFLGTHRRTILESLINNSIPIYSKKIYPMSNFVDMGYTVYITNIKNYINIASLRWYSTKYVDDQTEFRGSWEFHDNIDLLYQYLGNNQISHFFNNTTNPSCDFITTWENWWGIDNDIWNHPML